MLWRLIIKDFGPELKHIKGENNIVTNALSFLEKSDNQDILNISEIYGYDEADLPESDIQFFITILPNHIKLMLNKTKS